MGINPTKYRFTIKDTPRQDTHMMEKRGFREKIFHADFKKSQISG